MFMAMDPVRRAKRMARPPMLAVMLAPVLAMSMLTMARAQVQAQPQAAASLSPPTPDPTPACSVAAQPIPTSPPSPGAAPATTPPACEPETPPPPRIDNSPVAASSLSSLDLFSAGRETGLGTDLWKGSSAAIARQVIPTLDTAALSPAGMALARSVLATAATAPDGAGGDAVLAAERIKALLDLGDAEGAGMILDRTPGLSNSAALSQVAADVALINDQPDKACAIGDALSADRDAVYWLRLRAFCQIRAGKPDLAQLTLTLANQQQPDPIFGRLMGALIAGGGDPGPASLRNGLDYAVSTQLKLDLTPAVPHAAPPIARKLAALTPPPPPPPPPPAPSSTSESPAPVAGPAPALISEADVLAMLRSPADYAGYLAAAKSAQPSIAGLVQAKAPLTAPIALATAAIAAGDLADADAIRAGLVQDQIPGAGPGDLAILDASLAAAHGKPDGPTLDKLVELGGQGEGMARQRIQTAATLDFALGTPMGPDARAAFASFGLPASKLSVARLLALDQAADLGLKGETALLALWIAEDGGVGGPGLADRARIIRALWRVGLAAQAQAFAVEGLTQLQGR
jgi:hypothetical protein